MPESRRHLLTALFGAAGVLAVEPLLVGLQAPGSESLTEGQSLPQWARPNAVPGIDDPSRLDQGPLRANQNRDQNRHRESFMIWSPTQEQIEKRTRLPPSPSPWSKKPSKSKNSPSKLEISQGLTAGHH